MPISPHDSPAQADHIEQEKINSHTNDTSKTTQTTLASVASFLLFLLFGFGKILSFPFRKLYNFINKTQKPTEEKKHDETPNTGSHVQSDPTPVISLPSVQPHEEQSIHIKSSAEQQLSPADIQEDITEYPTSDLLLENHEARASDQNLSRADIKGDLPEHHTNNAPLENHESSATRIEIKEDMAELNTSDASLKQNATENNMNIKDTTSQASPQSSPLLMNGKDLSQLFDDASEDDISQLSTAKMLMQHILSNDQQEHDKPSDWEAPPVIKQLLSQYTPNPVNIPSDPKCGVSLELLHDIQRINAMQSPPPEDIEQVKNEILQTAKKMLHELQSSPTFSAIRQIQDGSSPHPLDDLRPFLLNDASLEDINFGKTTCKWQKPRQTLDTKKQNAVPQHVYDIYRLSEIYSLLTTSPTSIKVPVHIHLPDYSPDLFSDKQACSEALSDTVDAMFAYAHAFSSTITEALASFPSYIERENINEELSKMMTGDTLYIDPKRPEIQKLNEGYAQLKSMKTQRCFTQYPDYMCLLISHMLSETSQDLLEGDMNIIFKIMFEAKYGFEQPTEEQRQDIINEIKLTFRRCVQEMKTLLVIQHKEQALKDGVPQEKIQQFLDTDDLVPELFAPPIHLIQAP